MKSKGEILANILSNHGNCYYFLHNTKEKSVAEKILNEGFVFENQLPHSSDRVNPNEPIEITYFLFQRKDYGNFTIVIAIPKNAYELYTQYSNDHNTGVEEVLSINEPFIGDNDEYIYRISPKYILGYFNIKTTEFVKNEKWDSDFISPNYKPYL